MCMCKCGEPGERVAIFTNDNIIIFTDEGKSYLETNMKLTSNVTPIYYDSNNLYNDITFEYIQHKTRKFVLNTLSQQILDLLPLIKSYSDAVFISGTSTYTELRGKLPNLYFILPTNMYMIDGVRILSRTESLVIYDSLDDVYVRQAVQNHVDEGLMAVSINDLTSEEASKHRSLVLIPIDQSLIVRTLEIASLSQHNIYIYEIEPSESVEFGPNINAVTIYYPHSTLCPQVNSYWNRIASNPLYTFMHPALGILPAILKLDISTLERLYLASSNLFLNSNVNSRYLPKFPSITPEDIAPVNPRLKFNYNSIGTIVWIFERITEEDSYRINFTKQFTKKRVVVVETNIQYVQKIYCNYYHKGIRYFIIDIRFLPDLCTYDDSFVICPRTFNHHFIQHNRSLQYTMADDKFMIDDKAIGDANVATRELFYFAYGTGYEDIVPYLKKNDLKFGKITDLESIPHNTLYLTYCGTNTECETMMKYISNNQNIYTATKIFRRYFDYVTTIEQEFCSLIPDSSLDAVLSWISAQPFIDSTYSEHIIPPNVIKLLLRSYYDLNTALFVIDPVFLRRFGYIV
jgi:hypothetical protein